MTFKFVLYCVITISVIWTMDTININQIFKKNVNPLQAKLFYFFLVLSMSYLVTNCIYDLFQSIHLL
ncbi:MAG: DUF1146 domain-containing protein [Bacilli bacterium]|nr:DUF1146 domain-containing protein [Bacilli bacterium]